MKATSCAPVSEESSYLSCGRAAPGRQDSQLRIRRDEVDQYGKEVHEEADDDARVGRQILQIMCVL